MCVCPERKREREPDEEGEGAEGGVDREGEGVGGGREGEAAEAEASRYQPPGRTFSRSVACETVSAEDLSRSFHFPFFLIRLNRTSFHLQVFTLQDYCSPSRTIFDL